MTWDGVEDDHSRGPKHRLHWNLTELTHLVETLLFKVKRLCERERSLLPLRRDRELGQDVCVLLRQLVHHLSQHILSTSRSSWHGFLHHGRIGVHHYLGETTTFSGKYM